MVNADGLFLRFVFTELYFGLGIGFWTKNLINIDNFQTAVLIKIYLAFEVEIIFCQRKRRN